MNGEPSSHHITATRSYFVPKSYPFFDYINTTNINSTLPTIPEDAMTTLDTTSTLETITWTTFAGNETSFNATILRNVTKTASPLLAMGHIQITLYAIIFILAIVSNFLVILTLVQNRRMRTITNVFLLNLAVSDLLLGVLCMPFTLVGALLRNFIFGEVMCKILPYMQGKYAWLYFFF